MKFTTLWTLCILGVSVFHALANASPEPMETTEINAKGEIEDINREEIFFAAVSALSPTFARQIVDAMFVTLTNEQVDSAISEEGQMRELITIALDVLGLEEPVEDEVDSGVHGSHGYLHLENGVVPLQYIQAHFGGSLHFAPRQIVQATPRDACGPLSGAEGAYEGKYVYVPRGTCNFAKKATFVSEANGLGIIVGNSEDGVFKMRAENDEQAANVTSSAIMISQRSARFLEETLDNHAYDADYALRGTVLPAGYFAQRSDAVDEISGDAISLLPALPKEKYDEIREALTPYLMANSGDILMDNTPFPFMASNFGGPLPVNSVPYVYLDENMACGDEPITQDLQGKMAIVMRGGCMVEEKVLEVEAAKALGILLVNHIPGLGRLGLIGDPVTGPTISVALLHQRALPLFQEKPTGVLSFAIHNKHSVDEWTRLLRFYTDVDYAWAADAETRKSTLDSLLEMYGEDELMLEFINAAYEKAEKSFQRKERRKNRKKKKKKKKAI